MSNLKVTNITADKWMNSNGTENFKCRAWVKFNGTGTVAITAAGNVSSITDLAVGKYTVNFATALPSVNYNVMGTFGGTSADEGRAIVPYDIKATSVTFYNKSYGTNQADYTVNMITVIGG